MFSSPRGYSRRSGSRSRALRRWRPGAEQLSSRITPVVSVDFNVGLGLLTITSDNAADAITVSHDGINILVNGQSQDGPTLTNTRDISIIGGGGDDTITLNNTNGGFGPGAPGDDKINFTIDGGFDSTVAGDVLRGLGVNAAGDSIDLGSMGLNFNGDGDLDLTFFDIESGLLDGQGGNNRINAGGSAVTGGPFFDGFSILGGIGDDTLIGSNGGDSLDGGTGNDQLIGDTVVPTGLYVSSLNGVLHYDQDTGAFLNTISGGSLNNPAELAFGVDGNLYVANPAGGNVLRFNGVTGAFIDVFATGLTTPSGLIFGFDGNLYVINDGTNEVFRFNGATGAFIDIFVNNLNLVDPISLAFGPDGNLFVVESGDKDRVQRFSSFDGSFIDTFVSPGSGGLSNPGDLEFGFDGFLYVTGNNDGVLRYSSFDGSFDRTFVPPGSGGLDRPVGLTFGPNGDLFVTSSFTDSVLRYNGFDGSFQGEFVSPGSGGLSQPNFLTFPNIFGGSSNDTLIGGVGNDVLDGLGGSDLLDGGPDQDTLRGGNDFDSLLGGTGNDSLLGQLGSDMLTGGDGNDTLDGGTDGQFLFEFDTINETADVNFTLTTTSLVGAGTDVLVGIEGATLTGGNGANLIDATSFNPLVNNGFSNGNTMLDGSGGNDTLRGGPGFDNLTGGLGNDSLDGGGGFNQLSEIGDVNFTLTNTSLTGLGTDVLVNINSALLTGGAGNNTLDGAAFTEGVSFFGEAGNDRLVASSLNSFLDGGDGNDTLIGSAQPDSLFGGAGNDSLMGGENGASLFGFQSLQGGDGDDTILGGSGPDFIEAGPGLDSLSAGGGDDVLSGDAGNDTLDGGAGDDLLTETGDVNFTLTNAALTGGLGNDSLIGIEKVRLTGGPSDNVLDASAFTLGPVTLFGEFGGNDTLRGGTQADSLIGTGGTDSIVGGDGNDTLTSGLGNNTLDGSAGTDAFVQIGDFNLTLTNTALTSPLGADTLISIEQAQLTGGFNANLLDASGFTGPVTLSGMEGDDTLIGGSAADEVQARAASDFTLSNGSLFSPLLGNDTLLGIESAMLQGNGLFFGEIADNVFTIIGFTGVATLNGGEGADKIVISEDADFTLTPTQLTRTNGGNITLLSIEQVDLTGGISNNLLNASAFTGPVSLRGGDGDDTLLGGAADDVLTGGIGNDSLHGGAGAAWQFRAALIDPRTPNSGVSGPAVSVANGKLYVSHGSSLFAGGGFSATAFLSIYDIASDTWTHGGPTAPDSAQARGDVVGGTALGRHYAIGGFTNFSGVDASTLVEEFDPGTSLWSQRAPLPASIHNYASASFNDKVYVIGGDDANDDGIGTNLVYDAASNTWTTLASMPVPVELGTAVAFDGKILVFGGGDANDINLNLVQIYDIATNTWSMGAPTPQTRTFTVAGVIGNRIAVFGGFDDFTFASDLTTDFYDPQSNNWTAGPALPERADHVTGVVSDGTQVFALGTNASFTQTNLQVLTNTGGDDILFGEAGDDTLTGGDGDDILDGGGGTDEVRETADHDFILTNTSLTGSIDTLAALEQAFLSGGPGPNAIDASAWNLGPVTLAGGPGNDTLLGSAFADSLSGDDGNDQLNGGPGDDTVDGGNGMDLSIHNLGDTDADSETNLEAIGVVGTGASEMLDFSASTVPVQIDGGGGDDTIIGTSMDDTLIGGAGDNTLMGGGGMDVVMETADTNFVLTLTQLIGAGRNTLQDVEAAFLRGGLGNNVFNTAPFTGPVTLDGGAGNDTFMAGAGNDNLMGGPGVDCLVAAGDNDFTLTNVSLLSNLFGNDTLQSVEEASLEGGASANRFTVGGFSGTATVNGGDGDDAVESMADANINLNGMALDRSDGALFLLEQMERFLLGGGGGDNVLTITCPPGLNCPPGGGSFNGGGGADRIVLGGSTATTITDAMLVQTITDDILLMGVEEASLTGTDGNDLLDASTFSGRVSLFGGLGNDTLRGAVGDDVLSGGPGNDSLVGGTGVNRLVETGAGTMTLSNTKLKGVLGSDILSGITQASLTGGAGANTINAAGFKLGPVTLMGGDGNDKLTGGKFNDSITGAGGVDNIVAGTGNDTVDGGAGNDKINGGAGDDRLLGGDGDDNIIASAGNDFLDGGAGALDNVNGGAGTDTCLNAEKRKGCEL